MCKSVVYGCTVIIFICMKATRASNESPSDGHKFTIKQGSYVYYRVRVDWEQARQRCAKAGAELWVPADLAEQQAVNGQVHSGVWTGINDPHNMGIFRTPYGESLSINRYKWYPEQPNTKGGKYRCVYLSYSYLYAGGCDWDTIHFVCKYPAATQPSEDHNQRCECSCVPPGQAGADAGAVVEEELRGYSHAERLQLLTSILNVMNEHTDK